MPVHNVLGLSHFILTSRLRRLADSSPLSMYYTNGEDLSFEDGAVKSRLVREPSQKTDLVLYKPHGGDLPALEIIAGSCHAQRPRMSYGLFMPEWAGKAKAQKLDEEAKGILNSLKIDAIIWDETLNFPIAIWREIGSMGCTGGLWICLEEGFDFERFSAIFGMKIIMRGQDHIGGWVRILNKNFSKFFLLLYARPVKESKRFYNDDEGLSALGWFVRDLSRFGADIKQAGGKMATDVFKLPLSGKKFSAVFYIDNKFFSHEIIAAT